MNKTGFVIGDDSGHMRDLRNVLRRFLAEKSPEQAALRLAEGIPETRELWHQLAGGLGLTAIGVPADHGGAGGGPLEMALVMEELGRTLAAAPYLSSAVITTRTLLICGDESAKAQYLPRMTAGEIVATTAFADDGPAARLSDTRSTAVSSPSGQWKINGIKRFVLDGKDADLVIVAANTSDGLALFAIDKVCAEVRCSPRVLLDATRPVADLRFDRAPAQRLHGLPSVEEVVSDVESYCLAMLAAEQVGGADRLLNMSVDYARARFQFGRPIGSFQAIKHKLVNLLVSVEKARALARYAALKADDRQVARLTSRTASAYCGPVFTRAALDAIQIHGGMGFTWEHPAHLYLRRAKSTELLFGSAEHHRRILAPLIGMD